MDAVPVHPRIDRDLAQRLDRLAFRAHAFHRWAHHPLCREYEGEVFRLGRRFRLCRGCTLAALGGLIGTGLGLAAPVTPVWAVPLLGITGFLSGLAALDRRRHTKLLTRALPAALVPFALLQAIRGGGNFRLGLAAFACGAALFTVLAYRRRGPDRAPCATCPEREGPGPCRGYRRIRDRERAFARLAARWLRTLDPS